MWLSLFSDDKFENLTIRTAIRLSFIFEQKLIRLRMHRSVHKEKCSTFIQNTAKNPCRHKLLKLFIQFTQQIAHNSQVKYIFLLKPKKRHKFILLQMAHLDVYRKIGLKISILMWKWSDLWKKHNLREVLSSSERDKNANTILFSMWLLFHNEACLYDCSK